MNSIKKIFLKVFSFYSKSELKSKLKFGFTKKITVYEITLAGLFLSFLLLMKGLEIFIPKTPIGVSGVELYGVTGALFAIIIPLRSLILSLAIAPVIGFAFGQTFQINVFSFFLDYTIPVLTIVIINFSKNKGNAIVYVIIAAIIKHISHSISGVIFFDTEGGFSASLNAPFTGINAGVAIFLLLINYNYLQFIDKFFNRNNYRY